MLKFFKNILDDNAREIKRLKKTVEEINRWEPEMERLDDDELRAKTVSFKGKLAAGAVLEDVLPEAFAVVREASRRVLGLRHFDVQLMGGIVLHEGKIAEMKTGEGKTLVATLPVYLNALTGLGVHVITVNDYLARRDSEWMGAIYRFLGLSVGLVVHGQDAATRKEAYAADVAYGTNNEFGFDYLRDNMVLNPNQLVQRELNYAIIDEVDSILIDEARTPLIISGQADRPTDLYYKIAKMMPRLKAERDFDVDEKAHSVTLTEEGVTRVEKLLGVENLYADDQVDLAHHVNQGLKANALMKRDRDYVVKDGQVIIVDEFTGRLMFGRRYSEGLHQAIEAKEGVKIERESQTLATITFQNYFRMYRKLAGMTGTAETEQEEFRKIYKLDVVVIPTHRPMIRDDQPDVIYRTVNGKFISVVEDIADCNRRGQPILVGTVSIEKSEILSKMLKKRGIPHQVLNAKFHEQEAEIVAQAGKLGMVTIATNMAGRGTDIILGGNPEYLAKQALKEKGYTPEMLALAAEQGVSSDPEVLAARKEYQELVQKFKQETDREHEQVVKTGGLYVLGTERHESRRVDNQLRGRAGRQGDPGVSRFYISLEDDLMRLFSSVDLGGMMDKMGMDDTTPIEHNLVTRSIETAQKRVEGKNFDVRKHVLDYDDVMNQQREVIYKQRRQVLAGENLRDVVLDMLEEVVESCVEQFSGESKYPEEWDLRSLLSYCEQYFLPEHTLKPDDLKIMTKEEVLDTLKEAALEHFRSREEEMGQETMRQLERLVMLRVVDNKWMDHLNAMDQLRHGIGMRAYGQRDPLVEYKFEAYNMFQEMIAGIRADMVRYVSRAQFVQQQAPRKTVENRGGEEEKVKQPVKSKKIKRNDPCPCGSGRKYKHCCGRN